MSHDRFCCADLNEDCGRGHTDKGGCCVHRAAGRWAKVRRWFAPIERDALGLPVIGGRSVSRTGRQPPNPPPPPKAQAHLPKPPPRKTTP